MKRAFIIFASIIVIIGLGIAAYFLFFSGSRPTLTAGGNPFADTGSGASTATPVATDSNGKAGTEVAPNLVKITDGPVALGVSEFQTIVASSSSSTPAQTDIVVRYIDRASGNVYNYLAHARTLTRLSNRTLPGVQQASWLADGSMAYVRFIAKEGTDEHLKTYALPANGVGGFFLEDDLAAVSAIGSSTVFSLLSSTDGSTGTTAHADGTSVKTLFTSILSQLTVHGNSGGFFATTKPSSALQGYAFMVTSSGILARILGPAPALTILPSPSGKSALYSYTDGGVVRLGVMDVATRAQTPLPVQTLTEKCVWSNDNITAYCAVPTSLTGNLPDDWYQGAVSFSDRIWKIDLVGRVATLIVDPNTVAKTSIDAVSLSLDSNNDVLVFTDKKTGSLWAYNL